MTVGSVGSSSSGGLLAQLRIKRLRVDTSFQRLSSGKRINSGADDPAGLAVAVSLLSRADKGAVAIRNISDGVSAASIADGALSQASEITTRLSELAAQAANGTLSDPQRQALNEEYQALSSELGRIGQTASFNGRLLLNGQGTIDIQSGTDSGSSSTTTLSLPSLDPSALGLAPSIGTQSEAQAAVDAVGGALDSLVTARGEVGAATVRLESTASVVRTQREGDIASASRITDVDVAQEAANLVANSIGLRATSALLAQANANSGRVLDLLS